MWRDIMVCSFTQLVEEPSGVKETALLICIKSPGSIAVTPSLILPQRKIILQIRQLLGVQPLPLSCLITFVHA